MWIVCLWFPDNILQRFYLFIYFAGTMESQGDLRESSTMLRASTEQRGPWWGLCHCMLPSVSLLRHPPSEQNYHWALDTGGSFPLFTEVSSCGNQPGPHTFPDSSSYSYVVQPLKSCCSFQAKRDLWIYSCQKKKKQSLSGICFPVLLWVLIAASRG